jgi:hypothetical protein
METKPTQETSPTANMQSARMALTAARQVIMDLAETTEHGATRRGMMIARSQIGLMLDEMALKKEPTDTIVDLLIALSLPQKANDLESAKKRLAEIMGVACPACGTQMGINPEDGQLGCPHVACCNIGGQNVQSAEAAHTEPRKTE